MSKSFKKVIACLLAVLMVTFSVPFSALAAGYDYEPDIRIQFGALNENAGDSESWVSNLSEGSIDQKGKNTSADFSMSSLSAPELTATGALKDAKYSVSALTLSKDAIDTYLAARADADPDFETDKTALDADYTLQAGDTFTVTVRMDGLDNVYVASSEIAYSDNIEPVYVVENGKMSSTSRTVKFGTADQVGEDPTAATALADFDAQALYTNINVDDIGSVIKPDYDGQMYMYSEIIGTGTDVGGTTWGTVTKEDAPVLANADGTLGNTYSKKSVMATYMFVLKSTPSADNPIQFWIHNGNTAAHSKDDVTGEDGFSSFNEGMYEATSDDNLASAATYAENRFNGPKAQFGAPEAREGSFKVKFMGKNENVQDVHTHTPGTPVRENEVPATCTQDGSYDEVIYCTECGEEISRETKTIGSTGHAYVPVVTAPTCTEGGYTTYTCSKCQDSYIADYTDPTGHTLNAVAEVPATCTTAGTAAYWECSVCHKLFSDAEGQTEIEEPAVIPALQHEYTSVVTEPTCTEGGYTTYTCIRGDDQYTSDYTNPLDHDYVINSIDWDTLNTTTGEVTANYVCSRDASHTTTDTVQTTFEVTQQQTETLPEITTYTYSVGEFNDSKEVQTKAPAGHTHNLTAHAKVPATCTEDGSEAYWVCSGCGKMYSDAEATNEISNPISIPAPGHTPGEAVQENVVPASCSAEGSYDEVVYCTVCNAEISREHKTIGKLAHTPGEAVKENEVPATATTDGSYDLVTYCTECNEELSREHVVVPAEGMKITVTKYDIGNVTINGEDVDGVKDQTFKVPYNSQVTLAATEETDFFKGWESNGKIVSTDATFTTYAYTNMTITPVFEAPSSQTISVVFYDKFGNEVKAYKDMTAAEYQEAIRADGIPTAQNYPSSRFVAWDTADADIYALDASKTIWAVYEDVESTDKYTVTVRDAQGADITDEVLTLPAGIAKDAVPYDTKATLKSDSAKGWQIDGVTVSTEDTYAFFVGANTTVTMLTDDVEAVPTTTIIGANRLAEPAYRYNIMATRFVPAGYELVDYGFVYGKNLTDADLAIENEGKTGTGTNSGAVKVARAGQMNSASNEFALNYGVKTAGNKVTAKSFIVVKKGNLVQTVYSDMAEYDS